MKKSFTKIRKSIAKRIRKKPVFAAIPVLIVAACIILVYGFANFYLHKDKTYSNLYLAQNNIGGLSEDELSAFINFQLSQTQVEINYGSQKEVRSAADLGIYANEEQLRSLADSKSFWSAFRPWFIKADEKLILYSDESRIISVLEKFQKKDFKPAKNAQFTVQDNKLVIKKEKAGYGVASKKTGEEIAASLSNNLSSFSKQVEADAILPEITEQDIRDLSAQIETRLDKQYSISAAGSVVTAQKSEIASWLKVFKNKHGQTELTADKNNIQKYVKEIADKFSTNPVNEVTSVYKSGKKSVITTKGERGRLVTNIDTITEEIISKFEAAEPYKGSFILADADFKKVKTTVDDTVRKATYTYDVAVWGAVKSDLAGFKALAAQTLADSHGWRSGGVSFQEVSSGGNFTLVLASPSRVAGASATCSSSYSCRVGRYVIINDDRWRLATPSWNSARGSLRDYRHMVVNHETGHWLGFSHRYCAGSGQLAPVMQQQSISLQGCKFNPWPTAAEIASL